MSALRRAVLGWGTGITFCLLLACAGSADAQDALRGKRLYHDVGRLSGSGVSCIDCHGGLPGALHGLAKAAGRPGAIDYALNSIQQMLPLRGRLSAADMADLAAYIANPAIASPELRLGTAGPGSIAWSTERIEYPTSSPGMVLPASSIRLSNAGTLPLQLQSAPALDGPHAAEFAILESDCRAGMVLDASQACAIRVTFRPRGPEGLRSASVGIAHDWIGGSVHVALIGRVAITARKPIPRANP